MHITFTPAEDVLAFAAKDASNKLVPDGASSFEGDCVVPPKYQKCRWSAPISFLSHRAFMRACKHQESLRYSLVAVLACVILVGGCSVSGAGAGAGVSPITTGSSRSAFDGAASQGVLKAPPLIELASCPVLNSAPSAFAAPPSSTSLSSNATWSFFPTPARARLHHANWRIHYFDRFKLLENTLVGTQYMLTMRGATGVPTLNVGQVLPNPSDDDESNPNEEPIVIKANLQVFEVPVQRVCAEETIGLSFLELLGVRGQLTRLGQYAAPTSACVLSLNLPPLEDEYGNLTLRAMQVAQSCDLVLGSNDAGPSGEKQHVSFAATEESDILARSEWIQFVAAFFNKEAAATAIFQGIQQRFTDTATSVVSIQSLAPPASSSPPAVAWISVYDGTFTISTAEYKTALVQTAGGKMFAPTQLSFTDVASFHSAILGQNVGVVIDESYAYDPTSYTYGSFLSAYGFDAASNTSALAPFLYYSRVYRYDGLIGSDLALDWFENAIPNADALLADVAAMIIRAQGLEQMAMEQGGTGHGGGGIGNHTSVWFRNIALHESPRFTSTLCASATAPLRPIEVEEGVAADTGLVVTCPIYLLQPWNYTENAPDEPTLSGAPRSTGEGGSIGRGFAALVLAMLIAKIM